MLFDFPLEAQGVGITGIQNREKMVAGLSIKNDIVAQILTNTPRHYFIDQALKQDAYKEQTLPIGFSQTISAPQVVAKMSDALVSYANRFGSFNSVLEVGTGCGYQTSILAQLFKTVYSIERVEGLHKKARQRLSELGFNNIHCFFSDGSNLQKNQTFDAIIITAAPAKIPENIIKLLSKDGCLISPEGEQGEQSQNLIKIIFDGENYKKSKIGLVDFVPLLPGMVAQ